MTRTLTATRHEPHLSLESAAKLQDEIRNLNDALTDAHLRIGETDTRVRDLEDALQEAISARTAYAQEVALYRALPLVPAADHARVKEQRDDALRLCDELARALQNASDTRANVALGQALDEWQAELRDAAKECHMGKRKERHDRMRALLAEQGRDPWGGVL
jgi:chorismate mutase